ncbi:hypothetical protein E5S69_04810 [Cupriavidus necator]|uniref:hypothetical protein n=1 Tax=Cupriavidus necator TaxID=106590 RepID=UPI00148F4466|nr:hypothetical protein [Cupriavidus necator]NOV22857.1 hypothetical protein [Cupriavidus necator]
MEYGITDYEKLKAVYSCFVFFYFVPRLLVFPFVYGERYLWTLISLCAVFAANYFVLRGFFAGDGVPTLYEACYGPVMSVWFALLCCKVERDYPGYYNNEVRRRWQGR